MNQFNLVKAKVLFPEGRIEKKDVKVMDGIISENGDCSNFDTRGEIIDLTHPNSDYHGLPQI